MRATQHVKEVEGEGPIVAFHGKRQADHTSKGKWHILRFKLNHILCTTLGIGYIDSSILWQKRGEGTEWGKERENKRMLSAQEIKQAATLAEICLSKKFMCAGLFLFILYMPLHHRRDCWELYCPESLKAGFQVR